MTAKAPQSLDHDQFQAAVKAARGRFSQLREKHPTLKGYLVFSTPSCQTNISNSPVEIFANMAVLIVNDAEKDAFSACIKKPLPKDATEAQKRQAREQLDELALNLNFDGSVRIEIRFDNLDYALIARIQSDELVDRELTPQTRASIRIVLGTLAAFASEPQP